MKVLMKVTDASLVRSNIATKFRRDAVGKVHFRCGSLASTAAARFGRWQELALRGLPDPLSAEARIAFSLIIFDGVATRDDLERALARVDHVYMWNGWHCLDWLDDIRRVNRRFLSLFSQTTLANPRKHPIDAAAVLNELDCVMQASVSAPTGQYSLDLLLIDAQAWLNENASGPLFAHCARVVPIASLPKSTLAREETKLALPLKARMSRNDMTAGGLARAMGGYFDPAGNDQGSWLITELVTVCCRNRSLSSATDRQRMLKASTALAVSAAHAGPLSSLIVAWVIDLLESGTRTKLQLSAVTPAKYVAAAARRLLVTFRGKSLEDISSHEYHKIYTAMLDGLTSSQARTLASSLSSWHFFLSCWFDIDPLPASLHKLVPMLPPKANLVWPHELDRIRAWLETPGSDARLHGQLVVGYEILRSVRIRATELLNLRMCNLQIEGDAVKVEVATKASDGGIKSAAGKRSQLIGSEHVVSTIRAWLLRRRNDGALPEDYIFGDPYRPERQYKIGQLYLRLNRLLKAATGDSTIATHALSHTRVSFDWLDAARKMPQSDMNPFEICAAAAGHETSGPGFSNYFHFAEELLREQLDSRIGEHLNSLRTVRSHVALTPSAYRKACSRWRGRSADVSVGAMALHFIRLATPSLIIPLAGAGLAMVEPENPLPTSGHIPLDLAQILDVLNDIWFGHSPEAICSRSSFLPDMLSSIAAVGIDTLWSIGEMSRRLDDHIGDRLIAALSYALNGPTGSRIQFSRSGQGKVAYLYDYLATGERDDLVAKGIESWMRCYKRGYFSLERPEAAAGFVALLDAAEFPRSLLVVRGISTLIPRIEAGIEAIFQTNNAVMPTGEVISHRYGRPRAYLTLGSTARVPTQGCTRSNAALGMGGVHAVMFATAVQRGLRAPDFFHPPQ